MNPVPSLPRIALGGAALLALVGCAAAPAGPAARPSASAAPEPATFAAETRPGPLVVTHAGAGSPPTLRDGPQNAAEAALATLMSGADVLEAALVGTVMLEDDPRFNAGTGSNIRLDGETIQMDASLMVDDGRFAAVAVIERVKNPIRVARLVLDSPHVLMAGEGATRFAHRLGVADHVPVSAEAEAKYRQRMDTLKAQGGGVDWKKLWNFPTEMPPEIQHWGEHGDTVGTVARSAQGRFAATLSSGGTSITLYGRVGDVPIYGAGLFAGPAGAVACTGKGEEIIKQSTARFVYEAMARGQPVADAVRAAIASFAPGASVGIIAVDRAGFAVGSNLEMAYGVASPP